MVKQYRILEKIYKEGTKYQETIYYPQVVSPYTLNDKIDPWEFYKRDDDQPVHFYDMDVALAYIEQRIADDVPVRTVIHDINTNPL
jgi:hypothetical protein